MKKLNNKDKRLATMAPSASDFWQGFLSLIYPSECLACAAEVEDTKAILCTKCQWELSKSKLGLGSQQELEYRLAAAVNLEQAFALFRFVDEGLVQKLQHSLKYLGRTEVGVWAGQIMARQWQKHGLRSPELIIPVPLHSSRQEARGYNQSDFIAKGIAQVLQCPWSGTAMARTKATRSQVVTKSQERWANVEGIFQVLHPEAIQGKHLLLVDDVVTTGATILSAAAALEAAKPASLSIATFALAGA